MADGRVTYGGFPVAVTDQMADSFSIAWTCSRCGGELREWQRLDALRFLQTIVAHMHGHAADDEAFGEVVGDGR